jgi:MFS family permease
MTSLSSKYYQFILAQGICSPIGACAIFYASNNAVSTWFHERRALALGIMTSGSSVGGVIFPIIVQNLVPKLGFAWAMRICAFLILFLMIIANLTIQSRLTHSPKRVDIMEFVRPFREVPFLLTTAASFFFFWGMYLPFTFIISQAEQYGMSARLAGYLIPIFSATRYD